VPRRGRSTADVVFAKRILADVVLTKTTELYILGIDLSRAFDTVDRAKLLEVISEVTADVDMNRMVLARLTKTILQIRVGGSLGTPFESKVGTLQGDSISPVNCYYEAAMRCIRQASPPAPQADIDSGPETQYADDMDLLSSVAKHLEAMIDESIKQLPHRSLSPNHTKTERVYVVISEDPGDHGKEAWRYHKTLGSLLGCKEDIQNRINASAGAVKCLWDLWGAQKVSLKLKVFMYNIYVKPVQLYNCGTWGSTKMMLEKLNATHRRNLRRLAGIRWPHRITNQDLYEITGEHL